jgi:uncharacterized protein (TIGR02145 family)
MVGEVTFGEDRHCNPTSSLAFNSMDSSYVDLGIPFPSGNAAKSFALWIKPETDQYQWFVSGGTSDDGLAFGLFMDPNASNPLSFHGNGAASDLRFSDIPIGAWSHVAITFSGDRVAAFLNGEFIKERPVDLATTSNSIWLGARNNNTAFLSGQIDNVGIWSRELLAAEILQLYESSGCTNVGACNYDSGANFDDGSCDLFTCKCLEGTIWSEERGGCIVAKPSDSNFDGCVQLNDLLDLLTAYGDCAAEESPWQCGDPLEYQGYDYETVQIGEQCWFAENSRYFPEIFPFSSSPSCNDALAYVTGYDGYDENAASEFVQGGSNVLYNAFAVADWNLCPSGWHVSTDGDWVELEVAIGMSSTEANSTGYRGTDEAVKLASTNWFGTDEFGFTMMSSAWRDLSGGEYDGNGGGAAHFWTSTPSDEGSSWYRYISAQSGVQGQILRFPSANNAYGYSVRCIKD